MIIQTWKSQDNSKLKKLIGNKNLKNRQQQAHEFISWAFYIKEKHAQL